MQMSPACLPPSQPAIRPGDLTHPLFPIYRQYRSAMALQLVQAESFADWLASYEREQINTAWSQHSLYPAFMAWMRANRGGARKCPAGCFPNNFRFWIEGGRW